MITGQIIQSLTRLTIDHKDILSKVLQLSVKSQNKFWKSVNKGNNI